MVPGVLAILLSTALSAAVAALRARFQSDDRSTFDDRIAALVDSLQSASRTVTDMEEEIQSRTALVEKLRQEQQLLEFSKDEVDAVAQQLNGALRTERHRTFWSGFATNGFFFGLGLVAAVFVH